MDVDKAYDAARIAKDAAYAAEQKFLDARGRTVLIAAPEVGDMFRTRGGDTAICMISDGSDYRFLVIRRDRHTSGLSHVCVTCVHPDGWTGLCNDANLDKPHVFDIVEKLGKLPR